MRRIIKDLEISLNFIEQVPILFGFKEVLNPYLKDPCHCKMN